MATAFSAARFTRRVVVKARDAGVDAAGQPTATWGTTVATLWAQVDPPGAAGAVAQVQAGREGVREARVFRVRYRTDLTDDMRLELDGLVFDITLVQQDHGGHQFTDLVALRVPT